MSEKIAATIKQLGHDECYLLRQLLNLFGTAFEDEDTYTKAQPSDAYLKKRLSDETFIALIAMQGENVVGGLAAYELKKFEQERSEFYIYDLAVDADHRRKGIATALIDQLKEIAKSRGVFVIFVQADYDDPPAIALYTKLGVREDVLHFDIEP
ncbi:AAC(3)-I family aminoglycoside N-acetyltransferase [Kordiimonas aquimaris]|uniref:AAC(3)-I family aminoglycoside N-acetyltransferase n=1 Tax=Kordiimonas aquimaris TaxID=707591 RepID=UPI0021CE5B71|nr:AAC(3)-I family aminoglycoside N-acetyltransferase [Kordiimonas aquimaris]